MEKLFNECGATIVILDLCAEAAGEAARNLGGEATGIGCDVSDEASVSRTLSSLLEAGSIDVLVNSAGVSHVGLLLTTLIAVAFNFFLRG
jgi:NAD(P)-dependent dehydrogenase (short-subunit alcohol dehydrogenase family)